MKMYGGVTGIRDEGGVYNSVLKFLIYSKRHISNPYNVAAFVYAEFATRHHFMTAINEWLT
ncbi:MAG: hypothetical protein EPN86_00130 [Nanoarchaeota archaeon]|nr:MAG: hypothetical protein EPN86_00130 [Nanoarchaeota archaeon]